MNFYEFFAGGGMARTGFGSSWNCLFANDFDEKKASAYRSAFKDSTELKVGDVAKISTKELPGQADLAWASFPCQDLSLAGAGAGLAGRRSGVFWPFWNLMKGLVKEGRGPKTIILENVYGAITSHEGKDLASICKAMADAGYRFAPMVVDASLFLPHSRPRLFVLGFRSDVVIPESLIVRHPIPNWHPETLGLAFGILKKEARDSWVWLNPSKPALRKTVLRDLIEDEPTGVKWHTQDETRRLLGMMTPLHLEKVRQAKKVGMRTIGAIYKRTRIDENGIKRQRAEVRFDDIAGCLRTPAGGSSRQIILVVDGNTVKSRLLSPREAVRLMGLPDTYPLPASYNDAYKLAGDGVAVPVVSWLARTIIEPSLGKSCIETVKRRAAA